MSEELFMLSGVSVTVTGVYGTLTVVLLLLFMSFWLISRKKRTGQPVFAGQVMNGIGFGLLPALAFLKAFQDITTGKGSKVTEPLPLIRWLSEDGYYRPMRIETAAALGLFILLCLWLLLRKNELPDNGDLLLIALSMWSAIRLVTEDFRRNPEILFHFTSCLVLMMCVTVWAVRRTKTYSMPLRTAADLTAVCICIAVNILTASGVLSAGSTIADFAVKTGSALLALILTLLVGGDVRRMSQKAAQQG